MEGAKRRYLCEATACASCLVLDACSQAASSQKEPRRLRVRASSKKKEQSSEHSHMQHVGSVGARSETQTRRVTRGSGGGGDGGGSCA